MREERGAGSVEPYAGRDFQFLGKPGTGEDPPPLINIHQILWPRVTFKQAMVFLFDNALRLLLVLGAGSVLLTESLSLIHSISRIPLLVGWTLLAALVAWRWKPVRPAAPALPPSAVLAGAAVAVILGVTLFTALLSPPNSADAMAYHLPRVVYWAQQHSVEFFPTTYYNQVTLPPAAEYAMLQTFVLSGGDRFVNLVQWFGFAGCILAAALIAGEMGLAARGMAFAAVFCATLPSAILAASGAKNDLYLSLWIMSTLYFALRRDWWWMGASCGLALATKPTAFLFLPALLLWALLQRGEWKRPALALAAGALLFNAPQWTRNMKLAGSPLGFDSAHGDGRYRWRNEQLGWSATASNALRHLSHQLGGRSEAVNAGNYRLVLDAHAALGLDANDPRTTWDGARFTPPRNANHEADANNRWHLGLVAVAALLLIGRREWRLYSAALLVGALLFCFYLKWQPFMARLEVPLFIAASPLAPALACPWRPAWPALLAALFLLSGAQRPALLNWTRPLRGEHSLLDTPRESAYFNDMTQWNNRDAYLRAVEEVSRSGCRRVGIDISHNELEYPLMALLRARMPDVEFVHLPAPAPAPCARICIDCPR
jgi:hypothetical protein